MRAVVVALADLGRCARMQYHARALADAGVDVDLVGLEGTPLSRLVTDEPRIRVHRLKPAVSRFRHEMPIGYSGFATGDAVRLAFRLWRRLRTLPRPDLVLVQNPPAFPTLAVTWFTLRTQRRAVS